MMKGIDEKNTSMPFLLIVKNMNNGYKMLTGKIDGMF
jgi:hypothetical protein